MGLHVDQLFAPVDEDNALERIAGGNETEVYRSDDGRFVVKVKSDLGGDRAAVLAAARALRAAADSFAGCLGPRHSLPSYYVVARDSAGLARVLVLQPFVAGARPLFSLDYRALDASERRAIAQQLRDIIRRSLRHYRDTGSMPDLYGRASSTSAERHRLNRPWMLPHRLWSFLVQRNLLRSHNLLLAPGDDGEPRVVLVDYDPVRRGRLYRAVYYLVRWFLFWRDHFLISVMRRSGGIAPGK